MINVSGSFDLGLYVMLYALCDFIIYTRAGSSMRKIVPFGSLSLTRIYP